MSESYFCARPRTQPLINFLCGAAAQSGRLEVGLKKQENKACDYCPATINKWPKNNRKGINTITNQATDCAHTHEVYSIQ